MLGSKPRIHAETFRKFKQISSYLPVSSKSTTSQTASIIMEHLKTLRSYLTNATPLSNGAAKKEDEAESPVAGEQIDGSNSPPCSAEAGSQPNGGGAGASKPSRFPNFLSFRSQSEKQIDVPSAQRTKFIKTANATRQAKKTLDKVSSSPGTFDSNAARNLRADPSKLFTVLDAEYDKLIKHFELVISQSSADSQAAQQLPPNNLLESSDVSPHVYLNLSRHGKELLRRSVSHYNDLLDSAPRYDFDTEQMPANGYRSLNQVFENCCRRLIAVTRDLNDKKKSIFFVFKFNLPASLSTILKDFQIWLRIMEKIEFLLKMALDMQELQSGEGSADFKKSAGSISVYGELDLFVHSRQMAESNIERDLFQSSVVDLECFFGRACGFQFCDSLAMPMTGVSIAFASYNDGYQASAKKEQSSPVSVSASSSTGSNTLQQAPTSSAASPSSEVTTPINSASSYAAAISLGQAAKSLFSSTKYIMDPELRAKKITQVFKNADVEFCKAFWQLTETSIVQMGTNMITPTLAMNSVKKINFNTLKLPRVTDKSGETIEDAEIEYVDVLPPTGCTANDSVQIRIMSAEIRDGMKDLDKLQPNDLPPPTSSSETFNQAYMTNLMNGQSTAAAPKSSCLILHAHGGGFIAHSSKSHEIYLRPWCKELKIPIVSIDYSLAPEFPFPRASEECFYVYAWCLQNKNLLGWTGEKIICVGDSAGGVLVTNIVQRAINAQIRVPDALVPIYTPFLLTYSLSPSRLLSVIDPVLNIAILWRCLAAYCGVDFKSETERLKRELNLDSPPASGSPSSPSTPTTNKTFFNRLSMRYFKDTLNTNSNGTSAKSHKKSNSVDERAQQPVNFDTIDAKFIDESPEKENDETATTQSVSSNAASSELSLNGELGDEAANKSQSSGDLDDQKKRLVELYNVLGDSVFLIEKLRNHPAPLNPYMSPLLSSDELLSKFPKTYLITASHDPLLDDNVEMGKRLKRLNVACSMHVISGLHHGFLNFINVNKESHKAAKHVTNLLKAEMAARPDRPDRSASLPNNP